MYIYIYIYKFHSSTLLIQKGFESSNSLLFKTVGKSEAENEINNMNSKKAMKATTCNSNSISN